MVQQIRQLRPQARKLQGLDLVPGLRFHRAEGVWRHGVSFDRYLIGHLSVY
jgi:hypothetical protein